LVPIRAGASLVSVVQPKIPRPNAKKRNAIAFIRNCSFHEKLSKNIVTKKSRRGLETKPSLFAGLNLKSASLKYAMGGLVL
jgi:hypothetical protein